MKGDNTSSDKQNAKYKVPKLRFAKIKWSSCFIINGKYS